MLFLIVHVEEDADLGNFGDRDVVDADVLDDAASAAGGLEAEWDIGAGHVAVVSFDIADAARHFRADGDAAVAPVNVVVADDDVVGGAIVEAAGFVAAGLQADVVVAGVDGAIFDEDIRATIDVDAIAVLGPEFVKNVGVFDFDVIGVEEVDVPGAGISESGVLEKNVLAVGQEYVVRAEEVAEWSVGGNLRGAGLVAEGEEICACAVRETSLGHQVCSSSPLTPVTPPEATRSFHC